MEQIKKKKQSSITTLEINPQWPLSPSPSPCLPDAVGWWWPRQQRENNRSECVITIMKIISTAGPALPGFPHICSALHGILYCFSSIPRPRLVSPVISNVLYLITTHCNQTEGRTQSGGIAPEWSTAVIRDHDVATPALLCHNEPARRIQSPSTIPTNESTI